MYSDSEMDYSESSIDSETAWLNECLKQFTDISEFDKQCNICNVRVTNNENYILNHVDTEKHKNGVETLKENHQITTTDSYIYFCELCESYTDDFMAHIKTNIDHINWKWIYGGVDKNKLKRYVYWEEVQSPEADNYIAIYRAMLVRNCISKFNDTHFYCEPCELKLNRTSEIDHMFGRRHTSGLEEYQRIRKV